MKPDSTQYRLLAVDIDGTLVGPTQTVRPRAAEALRRASEAGLKVCLATGRTLIESQPVWRDCRLRSPGDPAICMGGAMVSEPDTGRTLHTLPIPPETARAAAELLAGWNLAAVGGVDSRRWGFDYYLTEGANTDAIWRDWFSKHPCEVRPVKTIETLDDGPELLRLTALVEPARAEMLRDGLRDRLGDAVELVSIYAPNYDIHVLECYGRGVNKWRALQHVAEQSGIGAGQIAAIGDDVNDVPMLEGAGVGAAMGNAPEHVKQHADHVTAEVGQDGLADFVDQLLAGRFD